MNGRLPGDLSTHTHFFRGEAELEAALSVLLERVAAGRSPRLWCAGCSTGAEPYTLAMLCDERGIDATIHATDFNAEVLAAARAARFPEIALRFTPPHLRERYFVRDGSDFAIVPSLVARVTFEWSDLRTDPLPYGAGADGELGWDVILCRNVLIYYEPGTADAIVARLATVLRADGVLIVGSTDPLAFRALGPLRAVGSGSVAVYARADSATGAARVPGVPRALLPPAPPSAVRAPFAAPDVLGEAARPPFAALAVAGDAARLPVKPGAPAGSAAARPRAAPGEPDGAGAAARPPIGLSEASAGRAELSTEDPGVLLATACAHLAEHRWDDAERVLTRAERAAPLAPEPPLYLGVLRRKQGRFGEAADHLRRAVFLGPGCWVASYLLAGVWERLGEKERARLELSRTLATLGAMDRDAACRALPAGAEAARLAFDPVEVARACRSRLA